MLFRSYNLIPKNLPAGGRAGTFTGTVTLVDKSGNGGPTIAQQLQQLQDGLWYLNVHTTTFGGGEIRGQIKSGAATFYRLR